jgi:inorganic pyrophosphatase
VKGLDKLATHDDEGRLRAVLETPQGSRHKLKYEPAEGSFSISSTLPAGMSMPFDFGFFPRTKAQDGDPLDVLVLLDGPAHPGVTVAVRLLGVIEAEQSENGGKPYRNDRLIAVAEGSTERGDLHRLSDLDESLLTQIEAFFETYDRLTGKTFKPLGRRGERVAARYLEDARRTSKRG